MPCLCRCCTACIHRYGKGRSRICRKDPRRLCYTTDHDLTGTYHRHPHLEPWSSPTLWSQREHDFLCDFLYEPLCARHYLCPDDSGLKCLYHSTGLCQRRHDDCPDRCRHQYHIGSDLYFCPAYGCSRCCPCYHSFPGMLLYLVHLFSAREKDLTAYPQGKLAQRTSPHAGLCCLRAFCLYHAVYREYHIHVL